MRRTTWQDWVAAHVLEWADVDASLGFRRWDQMTERARSRRVVFHAAVITL